MNCTVESYDHDDRIIVVVWIKRDGPIDLSCFAKDKGIGIVARFRFLSDFVEATDDLPVAFEWV